MGKCVSISVDNATTPFDVRKRKVYVWIHLLMIGLNKETHLLRTLNNTKERISFPGTVFI